MYTKLYTERKGGADINMKGELNRTVMIYVDSYDHQIPTGHFHIAATQEMQSFQSLSQLLIKINDTLDQENFPQAFTELRTFQNPLHQTNSIHDIATAQKGTAATFSVRILFRQNASWQGIVTWLEGNQQEYFRSVLELIVLMDNALRYVCNP